MCYNVTYISLRLLHILQYRQYAQVANSRGVGHVVKSEDFRITLGYLASCLGISKNALRNYEKRELVAPQIGDNNYRFFESSNISALSVVRMYREMGIPIETIQMLMDSSSSEETLQILSKHADDLSAQQRILEDQKERVKYYMKKVHTADVEMPIQETYDGPVLYWRDRMTGKTKAEIEADNAWLSNMPYTVISGRLTFDGEILTNGECGMGITEKDYQKYPVPLDEHVDIVDLSHSITTIAFCRLSGEHYIAADYLPLIRYANQNGIAHCGKIYTMGVTSVNLRKNASYRLNLFLPVKK